MSTKVYSNSTTRKYKNGKLVDGNNTIIIKDNSDLFIKLHNPVKETTSVITTKDVYDLIHQPNRLPSLESNLKKFLKPKKSRKRRLKSKTKRKYKKKLNK